MTRITTTIPTMLGALLLCGAVALAFGPFDNGFDLSWHTIDTGSGAATGGNFELVGTVGQPDAGAPMIAGSFSLTGGFWGGGAQSAPPCPADLDGDEVIGFSDLLVVLAGWGPCAGCPADLDGDGMIGFSDLLVILAAWGACP